MYSVAKFSSRSGFLGTPLPTPFHSFELENIKFRYGATSMVAGKPGAGKSLFAMNMLTYWAREGLPAMYFAADSDEEEVASRLAAMVTGVNFDRVDTDFAERRYGDYIAALQAFHKVRFEYKPMTLEKMAAKMHAFEQVAGEYPAVVFIDNLINFAESSDDYGGMINMLNELGKLAHETRSHICTLHHASESWGRPSDPVPSAAVQGKVTQIPRLALTVAKDNRWLKVACVKNRNGPSYPAANRWMDFTLEQDLTVTDNYRGL